VSVFGCRECSGYCSGYGSKSLYPFLDQKRRTIPLINICVLPPPYSAEAVLSAATVLVRIPRGSIQRSSNVRISIGHPPRVKTTLIVVMTSTGWLLSLYGL
jgi:hypothetical protein